MAHTVHFVNIKAWFKSWVIIFTFQVFWVQTHSNQIENSGLKSRFLFCFIFEFFLMYRLIFQKPVHFLSTQMTLVSTFFQMFILLWLYNFVGNILFLTTWQEIRGEKWIELHTPLFIQIGDLIRKVYQLSCFSWASHTRLTLTKRFTNLQVNITHFGPQNE